MPFTWLTSPIITKLSPTNMRVFSDMLVDVYGPLVIDYWNRQVMCAMSKLCGANNMMLSVQEGIPRG